MQLVNLTRAPEIGANSYLIRAGERRLLLDAGMHPKNSGREATPNFQLLENDTPDCIVVTHAHQDHIGCLPVATRLNQEAPVLMTEGTHKIGDIMLHNSVNVMTRQREELSLTEYPLFTHRGIEFSRTMWRKVPCGRKVDLEGEPHPEDGSLELEFFEAGHILGAAGLMIRHEGRSVFYTGDVHFDDQTLMRKADFPESGVDVLIMETTRGDAPCPEDFRRADEERRLGEAIQQAFDRDAAVTIPVFALGKTQELLAMLWAGKKTGIMPPAPIYIGGLSTKITEVYDALAARSHRLLPDLSLLTDVSPYVVGGRDIDTLKPRRRCVFALSSGMMTENTLSNIFAGRILEDENQALFFVGYSDPDSPAGRIRAAQRGEKVQLREDAPPVTLRCEVKEFNFSAHARRESLLDYAVRLAPKKILLVHGDPPALEWFRSQLALRLPGTEVILPAPGQSVDL